MAKVVSSSSKRPRGARWLSPAASVSSRNQTQTEQALADLQRAIAGSALPTPLVRERFATEITTDVLRSTVLPVPVRHGITASVMALVEDELDSFYTMPEAPARNDHIAAYELRALVRDRARLLRP